ncbi:hypothetical protein [Brevundimonas naejangsanensis]|uniref:hypothetical protein n=1 Tax=Brevundimonas naejangsanensis TaxID=588932 RepID=UPI0026E9EC7B|nr:hypothetical protein [Brevundimonas naejangsanensis]
MANRNYPPTRRLSIQDAVQIWIRHWDGEHQHRIAAAFNVNQGRISEILNCRLFAGSREIAELLG